MLLKFIYFMIYVMSCYQLHKCVQKNSMLTVSECRRCRASTQDRDAKGIEEVENREGYPPPQPTMGSRGAS